MATELEAEPLVVFAEHLRDLGILDLPDRVAALERTPDNDPLIVFAESLRDAGVMTLPGELATLLQRVIGLEKLYGALLQRLESVCNQLAAVSRPQDVNFKPNIMVPVELMGNVLADKLKPVLLALSKRPVSEVHHLGITAPLQALDKTIATMVKQPAPEPVVVPPVDMQPLADAIAEQTKVLKKLLDKDAPTLDVAPLAKAIGEQTEALSKLLTPRDATTKKSRITQEYDGSWTVEREVAP